MTRTASKIRLALLLAAGVVGLTTAGTARAGETLQPATTEVVAATDAAAQTPDASSATPQPPPPPPPAMSPDMVDSHGDRQSTSPFAQEGTRPLTLFPAWHLASTRPIDPRIRPNAGLRIPRSYYPIKNGPLLYPNYSATEPDYYGGAPVEPWSVKESLALFGVGDDHVSSKFEEFRDVRSGIVGGIEGHFRDNNDVFNLVARNIGRNDQDLAIDGGRAGTYGFTLNYSETPHNYAFGAKSLWGGVGTSSLTLPDAMQADIQSSTSNAQVAAKLLGYVASAPTIDESLHRQTIGADVSIIATYPFVLKVAASNESREGIRPWSGSFGFGEFVEIPWPVKYDTHDVKLSAEFFKPESRIYANAAVRMSEFVDHIQSFTFDNPSRVQDGGTPGLNCTFACGPAFGRMSLYPSNKYTEVSSTVAVKKLPWNSTFNAYGSVGFLRQNEHLIPFSTDSADPLMKSPTNPSFASTDPAGLPRQTAETAMDTKTLSMRWTSDLSPKLRLVGQYRYYGVENNEEPFTIFQFVREDEDIRNPETVGGTYKTVLAQYSKHTATLEGTYNLSPVSKVSGVYTFERMNRDFREVKWMNDNKFKVEYDTVLFGAVELKSWYERTQRTTSVYEFDQYNIVQGNPAGHPMFPWIEKFDEAPLARNEAQVMATWAINDTSSVSTHVQLVGTNYGIAKLGPVSMAAENVVIQPSKDYQFGVRKDGKQSFGADYTWAPTQRLSTFVEAGIEHQGYQSMSRQWTVNGISDPYLKERVLPSNSNWIVDARDYYYTAGVGLDAQLIPDKLKLSFQYVFSKSDGNHNYSSPVGTAADDTNAFVPVPFTDVDDTQTHSFNPELSYQYSQHLSLSAGYQWEKWSVNDYNYKGFTYAPVYNAGVALLMGGLLPQAYNQNIAYVRVRMGF